jgi:DNA replication protein DnaC
MSCSALAERRRWCMHKGENPQTLLNDCLKKLCLATIKECYQQVAHAAQQESMSYQEYLLELVELECATRHTKRIERLLRESKLPLEKNLDTFNMQRLPRKMIQKVRSLLEGSFLDRKENVLAFGNPGSGKTHLLCALGQELVRAGSRKVYFTPCGILVQELLLAKRQLQLPRILKRLAKFEVIIIDDLGYVQQDKEEMEVLFTLLADRYERGSIMLTSNLPFSRWESIFKDPMITAAAIDRLVHHSVILELNLPSYRMAQAKERGKLQEEKTKKEEGDEDRRLKNEPPS